MPKDSELIVLGGERIYHLGLTREQVAPKVVVCGDPRRTELIAEFFDPGSVSHEGMNREFKTITGRYKGMPVSVIGTGIGTDNMEIVLVELYTLNEFDLAAKQRRSGAKPLTIIRVGTCGTPQPDVKPGTLAISAKAVGLDSTGLYYESPSGALEENTLEIEARARGLIESAVPAGSRFKGRLFPYASEPSAEVVRAINRYADGPAVTGITVSASGFFAPQGREVDGLPLTAPKLQEALATLRVDGLRVVNFEMETSLLFHLTGIMGYRAGCVCAVIANRATGGFLADYSPTIKRAAKTALDALADLNE